MAIHPVVSQNLTFMEIMTSKISKNLLQIPAKKNSGQNMLAF
jgi:hypothetical protein